MIPSPMQALKTAVPALVLSAAIQFACFARWPGNPSWDVHHWIFAAETLAHRGLKSVNLFPSHDDDLAHHAQLIWMTTWPPGHSFLYAAAMRSGISPGVTTKLLGLVCVLAGGLGWLYVARRLGG